MVTSIQIQLVRCLVWPWSAGARAAHKSPASACRITIHCFSSRVECLSAGSPSRPRLRPARSVSIHRGRGTPLVMRRVCWGYLTGASWRLRRTVGLRRA